MEPTTSLPQAAAAAAGAAAAKPAHRSRQEFRDALVGYAFILPALAILFVFLLLPALWVFGLSLFKWDLISSNVDFVGLANFDRLFRRDTTFWKALWQTLYFVLGTVPTGMVLGLALALLLNAKIRFRGLLRGAIFVPYVMPIVATAIIWGSIFQPDFGVLNAILRSLHLPASTWLTAPATVMPSIILYTLWHYAGYNAVIFLAGLSNIPGDLSEAAIVDGARPWDVFWRITMPLLSPTTYFVLLISLIGSFKVVNQILVFAPGGGPDNAAETIGFYLYQQAFVSFRAGYAGAISVVLFLIILAATGIQMRVASRRVFYG